MIYNKNINEVRIMLNLTCRHWVEAPSHVRSSTATNKFTARQYEQFVWTFERPLSTLPPPPPNKHCSRLSVHVSMNSLYEPFSVPSQHCHHHHQTNNVPVSQCTSVWTVCMNLSASPLNTATTTTKQTVPASQYRQFVWTLSPTLSQGK